MNRRARKKVAFALVGVATAAAAIDRLVLQSGPQTVGAGDRLRAVTDGAENNPQSEAQDPGATLADVFDMLSPKTSTPGVILESMPELFGVQAVAPSDQRSDARDASPGIDGLPILTGVSDVGGGAAVLNGRIVPVGETLGRYRLLDVSGRSALVSDGEERHRLTIGDTDR
jgi:hypothetical protein